MLLLLRKLSQASICLCACFTVAQAQIVPPPGQYQITVDAKIKELKYKASANPPPEVPNIVPRQEAEFQFSLDPIGQAPAASEYKWTVARNDIFPGQGVLPGMIVVDGSGLSRSVTGKDLVCRNL